MKFPVTTRSGCAICLTLVLALAPSTASAQEAEEEVVEQTEGVIGETKEEKPNIVEPQVHLLSANPDTPGATFVWRGQLRGTLGVRVPFVGKLQQPGLSMALIPLIELYNQAGSSEVLPNEGWRGQIGLQANWLWGELPTENRYVLGGYARHESDHTTGGASPAPDAASNALQFNEITLLGVFQVPKPKLMIRLELRARALFSSCTDIRTVCSGLKGSGSFGSEADLILDMGGAEPVRKHWYFFSSIHAAAVVPNKQIIRELRTTLHVGTYVPIKLGVWELFALGFFGNDIGVYRGNVVYQGGGGVRWTY